MMANAFWERSTWEKAPIDLQGMFAHILEDTWVLATFEHREVHAQEHLQVAHFFLTPSCRCSH